MNRHLSYTGSMRTLTLISILKGITGFYKRIKTPSLQEFYDYLETHNWYYQYEPYHGDWIDGDKSMRYIQHVCMVCEERYQDLYLDFVDYAFFNKPKPIRPKKFYRGMKRI